MIKALGSLVLAMGLMTIVVAGPQPGKPSVFALDIQTLEKNKARIKNNDPLVTPAYKNLLKDADKGLAFGPVSVMEKKHLPPSGDKHDYMSLAPYFWPDPSKADGLPYLRKDGETNPEVKEYKDKEYMPKLCDVVYTLSLAWYYSGNKAYADHAGKLLQVWFIDTATRMNPNLNFAQAIKGQNTGRGAGMIDSRHFVKLIDGIGLLQDAKSWTPASQQAMQQWFRDYLNWTETSKNGKDEMNAKNNHGAWYEAQRISIASFLGEPALVKKYIASAKDRLDKQMDASGRFPLEMERTISLHYTTFVMDAFFVMARMAERSGDDLWNYTSPSGKSLKLAFNELKPYLTGEKKWDGPQIKEFEVEEGYDILQDGYRHFQCKDCTQAIKNLAGDKSARLRIKLLSDTDF